MLPVGWAEQGPLLHMLLTVLPIITHTVEEYSANVLVLAVLERGILQALKILSFLVSYH